MKSWSTALRDGVVSGGIASIASTVVLSRRGQRENGTPYAPTNAISHWIWGERAARRDGPTARYTAVGYTIHHLSATLWAVIYEKAFGNRADRKEALPALMGGVAVAGLACFVDYKMTPHRLQPGFEKRLSTPSLFLVYGVFGVALAARGLISPARRTSRVDYSQTHNINRRFSMSNPLLRAYDRFEDAEQARNEILANGIPPERVQLNALEDEAGPVEGNFILDEKDTGKGPTEPGGDASHDLLGTEERTDAYNNSEPVWRASHVLVVMTDDDRQRRQAAEIMDRYGGIDVEQRTAAARVKHNQPNRSAY